MRSMRKNCIWKYFFGENKFSHLHFVSLLWAWVRIPPTTEFFSKLNKSIFLSLLHNQQIKKKHIFVRFNTSWYITNNLDSFFIIFNHLPAKNLCRNKSKKEKVFPSLRFDLRTYCIAVHRSTYWATMARRKIAQKIYKVLHLKNFIR